MKPVPDTDDRPWQLYICIACGLIYNEEDGDPDGGLAPGTRFEDIPDDWECPDCGVTKKDFKPFEKRVLTVQPLPRRSARQGIVVVGAGMAGWAMIEAIRTRDTSVPVTLITSCEGHRYNKPTLSVSFARSPAGSEHDILETASHAATRLAVNLITQTYAVSISSTHCQVRTTRGTFPYTRLVIAHGSKTALPPALPEHLCWRMNHLGDWNALSKRLCGKSKRIAVVGSGMVGCELAEDLSKSGHKVFLLSHHNSPLSNVLPPKASIRLQNALQQVGVEFISSVDIKQVTKNDDCSLTLHWENNQRLSVDEVIATTGVATSKRLALSAGLEFDHGIVVNPGTLQSSQNNIYAIGDCISINGQTTRYIEPIDQQTAVVADALANKPNGLVYQHNVPTVALKNKSLRVLIHGLPDNAIKWDEIKSDENHLYMVQKRSGTVSASLKVGTQR